MDAFPNVNGETSPCEGGSCCEVYEVAVLDYLPMGGRFFLLTNFCGPPFLDGNIILSALPFGNSICREVGDGGKELVQLFFVLLLLLAESTPKAAASIPLIGQYHYTIYVLNLLSD